MRKFYKNTEELPLINFIKITESGNLKYLDSKNYEKELTGEEKKEADKIWQNIIYSIKDLDVELPIYYWDFVLEAEKIELQIRQRKIIELRNKILLEKKIFKIKYFEYEKAFKKYKDYLNEKYTNFQISQWKPKYKNFKNKFEEITGIKDKQISKLFEIKAFYLFQEYEIFISHLPKKYEDLFLSQNFIVTFFEEERITIKNLNIIDNYLRHIFIEDNKYEDYILISRLYFDVDNLIFELKEMQEKRDIYDLIAEIEFITKIKIDIKNDSLKKFISQRILAEKISKNKDNG